jgi:ABC-type thiamin/hydroxymethylpyrimidine transport system permease subunit
MAVTAPARRPSVGARRTGYAIAAAINPALAYAINVRPGWQTVSFLTEDTRQLLGLVNLSLAAGLAANLVYLAHNPPWVKALGDLVTTGIGLAVLVRVWQVFPFDFGSYSFDWALLVRVLLVIAGAGAAIGLLVQLVLLAHRLADLPAHTGGRG